MGNHYKDSLFRSLFCDKQSILELYNSIKGTNYDENTQVIINTLSETLFTQTKNDVSFIVDGKLVVLAEHQSTINENMPFRFLLPIAQLFANGIADKKSVYHSKLIKLLRPEFIVLYNGLDKCDDTVELRLSDAFFEVKDCETNLELIVKVFNINKGHSEQIVKKSEKLNAYVEFVDLVRNNQTDIQKENPEQVRDEVLKLAITRAIEYCKTNNILKDFWEQLTNTEVNMLAMEYDRELELEVIREEALETGIERGIQKGIEEGSKRIAQNALREGVSPEVIQRITGLDTQTINSFSLK
jgi:predicted transposase/invertase (TIGR01784 family)